MSTPDNHQLPKTTAPRSPGESSHSSDSQRSHGTEAHSAAPHSRYESAAGGHETSILGLMWRGKWTLALCALLALAGGVAYLKLATPQYTSEAVLYVQHERPQNAPPALRTQPLDTARLSAHIHLLTSNTVLSHAVAQPKVAASDALAEAPDKVEALRHMLDVTPGNDEQIITARLTSASAEESARILNEVISAYLQAQQRDRGPTSNSAMARLRRRFDQKTGAGSSTHLSPVDHAADKSSEQAIAVSGGGSEQVVADRLKQLADRLTTAKLDQSQARSLLRSAKRVKANPMALKQLVVAAGLQPPRDLGQGQTQLSSRLSSLQDQKQSLGRTLGPNHRRMKALQARIDQARSRLQRWTTRSATILMARLREHERAATERRKHIEAAFNTQQQAAQAMEELPVQVIDQARPAAEPSAPKASQVLPISLVGGLMLGMVVILGGDFYAHDRYQTAAHSRERVLSNANDADLGDPRTPMLGVVPQTSSPAGEEQGIAEWDTTASSIHHIRAVLQVRARNQGIKSFAVTSPRRGAGKTSVAMGLASSMALSGTRTLVVDCDLASRIQPTGTGPGTNTGPANQQTPFRRQAQLNGQAKGSASASGPKAYDAGSAHAAGLVDVAKRRGYVPGKARQFTDTDAPIGVAAMLDGQPMDQCIIRSSVENLGIMPAGHVNSEHISRMSDAFIADLLDQASEHYDMILLDTGPVPGSVEALLTCSRADGVLMVAAQGDPRTNFDKALSYLNVVGATLAGTIFNRAGATSAKHRPPRRARGKAGSEESPDAAFIPKARQRPTPSSENYGSGLLAAAVFSGNSTDEPAVEGDTADPDDESAWDYDSQSVLAGLDMDDDDADEPEDALQDRSNV